MPINRFFLVSYVIQDKGVTVDPGYNERQRNDSGVSYNRTFIYPCLKRNEIASRGQDTQWLLAGISYKRVSYIRDPLYYSLNWKDVKVRQP